MWGEEAKPSRAPEAAGQWARRRRLATPVLAVLAVLAALVVSAGWEVGRLARYEIGPDQLRWIAGPSYTAPRRPLGNERIHPMAELPRRADDPIQVFHRTERVNLRSPPQAVLALALSGDPALYVNGVPVRSAEASAEAYLAAPGVWPELFPIPPTYFRPGANRYDLIFRGGPGRPLAASLYAGPEAVLRPAAERVRLWTGTARLLLAWLGAAAAILCLATAWARRSPRPFLALAAVAAAVGARAWLGTPANLETLGAHWAAVDRALLAAALLCLALVWLKDGLMQGVRARLAAAAGAVLVAAGFAAAFALAGTAPDAAAWAAIAGVGLCLAAAAVSAATAERSVGSMSHALQAGVAAVTTAAVVALLAAAWGSLQVFSGLWVFHLDVAYGLGAAASLAALALGSAVLLGRSALAFARGQLDLSRVVRRQREEIATQSQALDQEMKRSAILEERQRLARDMHDGIGGQLVSLIARVRSRRVGIDQVERELVGGLAELRLVVDSLDATGDTLAEALATFRSRVQPQADAAGMELVWRQDDDLDLKADDPRWVLNVYRLLQEAISNAVAHSGGDRLEVVIERTPDRRLRIEALDNGKGVDAGREGGGRGLSNMTFRAHQLGGELKIGPGEDGRGTRVAASLPLPETRAARPQSSGEISPS